MFVTVDQIRITQEDIQSLIDCWHADTSRIVCAQYANHRGVPAIFPKPYFSKLRDLQGDKGARNVIKTSSNVTAVAISNAELDILDYDKRWGSYKIKLSEKNILEKCFLVVCSLPNYALREWNFNFIFSKRSINSKS